MKILLNPRACKFTIVAFLGLLLSVHEAIAETGALADEESTAIRQRLDSYEKGEIDQNELFRQQPRDVCDKLIAYYFSHTNEITLKMKLPISPCLGATDHCQEAMKLATEYVAVYSNDWRGWRVLGLSRFGQKDYDGALTALTKRRLAWRR